MTPFLVRLATEIPFLVDDVLTAAISSIGTGHGSVMGAAHPVLEKMRADLKPKCTMTDGVGVIPVSGVLMQKPDLASSFFGEAEDPADILDLVNAAAKDPKCKAIVLNLDTPGGMMTGGVELADAVAEATKSKPVVAWTGSLCASLGYLIASQCSAVMSTRSAQVGSIGTILSVTDLSALYERFGVKVHTFTNTEGTLKALTPMNEERAAYLQARADAAFATFKGMVTQARQGIPDSAMKGQVFTGLEGRKNGMVDCLGSLSDAVSLGLSLASSGNWKKPGGCGVAASVNAAAGTANQLLTPMAKSPTESELFAQNAKLTADLTAATAALETANASAAALTGKVTALEANLSDVSGKLTRAEGDLASANAALAAKETELATVKAAAAKLEADNKVLAAKEQDLQKRVAVELAAKGIRTGALASAPAASGTKLSLTQECLAARSN